MHLAKGTRLLLLGLLMMALSAAGAHRGGEVSDLGREMLTAHNAVRTALHLSPLSWSDRLAASAQSWADALVESDEFCHTPNLLHGQNLFEIRGGIVTPTRGRERLGIRVPGLRLPLEQVPLGMRTRTCGLG
jgi:hypothetical protein